MRSLGNGSIVIVNREFLGDVNASKGWNNNTYALNPGLRKTFPWLSQVADSYEEYRIRGIVFTFKTTSTPFSSGQTSLSMGTVIMAAQYNVNSLPFTNKRDMENYIGATSGSPLNNQMFGVKPNSDPLKVLYVRQNSPDETDFDLRFYDYARFELATIGMSPPSGPGESQFCGELWVNYEIELIKPRLRQPNIALDHYELTPSALTGVALAKPFGTNTITKNLPIATVGNQKNNGVFRIGTRMISSQLELPDTLANTSIMITVALWNSNDGNLVTLSTDQQVMTITVPAQTGTVVDQIFWKRSGFNVVSQAPSAGTNGTLANNSKGIWPFLVTLGDMAAANDASSRISFAFTKTPGAVTNWYYDILVQVVNLDDWIT
jgi:hypothetical protein